MGQVLDGKDGCSGAGDGGVGMGIESRLGMGEWCWRCLKEVCFRDLGGGLGVVR